MLSLLQGVSKHVGPISTDGRYNQEKNVQPLAEASGKIGKMERQKKAESSMPSLS